MSNRDTNIVKQNSNFVNAKLDSNIIRNQTKYRKNGLTYVSNNDAVIPRDQGGNIMMQEDADNNPMLIIEPISTKITNNSMLKILDTQFTYFKFPTRFPIETTLDLDLDADLVLESDEIKEEYTFLIEYDSENQPNPFIRINTSYNSTWFYNDGVTTAIGFKELPFNGSNQPRPNGFTITRSIIDTLQSKSKTLKFTIQVQVAWKTDNTNNIIRLVRSNPKAFRVFEIPTVEAISSVTNAAPVLSITYVLNTNDLVEDDLYIVEAVSGNPAFLYTSNAYWTIEEIDIPGTQSLSNNIGYGVYNAVGDTLRIIKSYVPPTDPPTNPEILKIDL
jgi:hypothetical protein